MRIYKSSRPDIDLPCLDLLTLLFESNWCLAEESTNIHVEAAHPANSVTKGEARDLTRRVAHVLRHKYAIGAEGLGQDVVLTMSTGNPFIPVIFYAIVAAGGVFGGASTSFRTTELVRQIQDANVRLLICTPEYEAIMATAAELCGISRDRVLVLDWKSPKEWKLLSSDRTDVLFGYGRSLDWPRLTTQKQLQDTTICLLYSSGTTGLPKGVRISHWGIVASTICTMDPARQYRERRRRDGRDFTFNTIAHLPMANIAGIALYSVNPFYMGGTAYWMESYDFASFIENHRKFRPHYQFSVPPIWLRIAKSDKVTDHFDHLQIACTGSAPIGYATMKEVQSKIGRGKAYITQTWGATEANGVITALDWQADNQEWAVGEPCPNVRLRILDENDNDAEPDQPGELLVGGPILAQGYHHNPKADKEGFIEGYYRSGDIGVCTNGRVHILDRKKELIKYKGSQVAPAELEAMLTSHPRIADAAVIGIWNAQQETELPRAYVVRKSLDRQSPLNEQEVIDFIKESLSNYKQLRGGVVFVDEIPKSASGKILRKDIRVLAEQSVEKARL